MNIAVISPQTEVMSRLHILMCNSIAFFRTGEQGSSSILEEDGVISQDRIMEGLMVDEER